VRHSLASRQDLRNRCAALLVALGVLWSIAVVLISPANLLVAHPVGLVPVALWTAWPHRHATLRRLQDYAFLYLTLLVVLAAAPVFWDVTTLSGHDGSMRVSAAWGSILLMAVGRLLHRGRLPYSMLPKAAPMFWASGVLLSHGIVLALLLCWCYGYGWELDLEVAGRLGLSILVMVLLVPLSRDRLLRTATGLALAATLVWKS
jgi:hypothetical protein